MGPIFVNPTLNSGKLGRLNKTRR